MKKFFYSVLAAATMLFATTSCSQEEEILGGGTIDNGTTQKVTFTVQIPGEDVTSRAIADGVEVGKANQIDKLIWALYEENKEDRLDYGVGVKAEIVDGKQQFTAEIDMVKGLSYNVLFFAYDEDGCAFQLDATTPEATNLTALTLKSDLSANSEGYDAFVKCHKHSVNAEAETKVVLTRPFAQINAATTLDDLNKADKLKAVVTQSQLIIKGVPTQYNVLTGEASVEKDLTFKTSDILVKYPAVSNGHPNEEILVEDDTYYYLNMAYVLANAESNHEATFTFYRENDSNPIRTINITNLPIERNHRTNIIGSLITQTENFRIIIDEKFNEEDKNIWVGEIQAPKYEEDANGNKTYYITNPAELAWISAASNGLEHPLAIKGRSASETTTEIDNFKDDTILLEADLDLNHYDWTPISALVEKGTGYVNIFKGTFDGQGHTISNLNVVSNKFAGLFGQVCTSGSIKNLNVKNVNLKSNHYAGAIVAWNESGLIIEDCHVDGGTITVTPELINGEYDNGDKAGGIAGFMQSGTINNCSAKNLTISAYRDLGGIVGYVAGNIHITNNQANNIKLVCDQTLYIPYSGAPKDANVGEIIGRGTAKTNEGNTYSEIEKSITDITTYNEVSNAEELKAAIAAANNTELTTILLKGGTYTGAFNIDSKYVMLTSTEDAVIDGLVHALGSRVTLKGLTLTNETAVGSGMPTRATADYYCLGGYATDYVIENCVFNISNEGKAAGKGGINIYAANNDTNQELDGVTYELIIKNTIFNCNGERPIKCRSNVYIADCTFNEQYRYSVQVQCDTKDPETVTFINNKIVNPTAGKPYTAGVSVSNGHVCENVAFNITNNTLESQDYNDLKFVYDQYDKNGNKLTNVKITTCTLNGNQIAEAQCLPIANETEAYEVFQKFADGAFTISNLDDLLWFANEVNVNDNTFKGKTVKLMDNIDLNNMAWTPIGLGELDTKFQGTFDGNGKTISNLKIEAVQARSLTSGTYTSAGFFGQLNGIVKNFTIDGASVKHVTKGNASGATTNGIAVAVGSLYPKGTIEDVTVKKARVNGNRYVAGIVGYAFGNIKNCTVEDVKLIATPDDLTKSYDNGDKVGGIAGYYSNESTYDFTGCVAKDVHITGYRDMGIIVGTANNPERVTGNKVEGTNSITVNREYYYGEKDVNAGEVCGRQTGGTIGENTVNGTVEIIRLTSPAEINASIKDGENYTFKDDVEGAAVASQSYGKTGLTQLNGGTIDGNGKTLSVSGANGTWDCALNTTGGTIKNLTVDSGFRGIFINHNSDNCSKVYLENVIIDGPVYTISCDQGTNNGLEATGCTFNGWTSYAATIGDVKFTNCKFGEGAGYAYCRPYATTKFVDCDFEEGFKIDPCATITFKNCRLNGVELNAENLAILVDPYYGDAGNASVL